VTSDFLCACPVATSSSSGCSWFHAAPLVFGASAESIAVFTREGSSGSIGRRQRLTGPGRTGISIGGADGMCAKGF
jgi:hypothetical protein